MFKKNLILFCFYSIFTSLFANSLNVQQKIISTLPFVGLRENDFNFKKTVVSDPNLSPLIKTLLDEPLKNFEFSEALETELNQLPWQKLETVKTSRTNINQPFEVSAELWNVLHPFLNQLSEQKIYWDTLFSSISFYQKQKALAAFAIENFHLEKNYAKQKLWSQKVNDKKLILSLLQRAKNLELEETELLQPQLDGVQSLNPVSMRIRTELILTSVYQLTENLKKLLKKNKNLVNFDSITFETSLGLIQLGGKESHHYNNQAAITIDLGGNDTYFNAGNAHGLWNQSFRLIIDLEGNDLYCGQTATGIWGFGLVWDEKGNDRYRSSDAALGCGLFGTGLLIDRSGNDFYQSDTLAQGAAAFGYGLLLDQEGNDRYRVALQGQGFAGVNGLGILADYTGNDHYKAGGKYRDYDRFPNRTLSLSQGFSIGYRPFAPGGVGILFDQKGNDSYHCDVYGQGCSYWYSGGFLIDGQGNDTYDAYQYAQGTGIHLSVGLLKDNQGNDRYLNRNGLAQGSGHDFAVGLLWDKKGTDHYESKDSSQGCAINNAVGILCDKEGKDDYKLRNSKQAIGQGYGGFSPQRGIGSLGFLIDPSGNNTFSQWSATSHTFLTKEKLGFVFLSFSNLTHSGLNSSWKINLLQFGQWQSTKPAGQSFTTQEIIKAGGDLKLGELIKKAARYGDAPWKVQERNRAKTKLKKLPKESYSRLIPWVMQSDIMARVLMDELILANPTNWFPSLQQAIQTSYLPQQLLAAYWFGEKGTLRDVKFLLPLLKNPLSRPAALLALSKQKSTPEKIINQLLPYLKSQRELERALTIKIISKSQLPNRHKILFPFFDDSDWNVRMATWEAFQTLSPETKQWAQLHQTQLTPLGRYWLNYSP